MIEQLDKKKERKKEKKKSACIDNAVYDKVRVRECVNCKPKHILREELSNQKVKALALPLISREHIVDKHLSQLAKVFLRQHHVRSVTKDETAGGEGIGRKRI